MNAIKSQLHLRWMIRRDMPEVLQIEQASETAPWTEETFLHTLRGRNCISFVTEMNGKVVAFMVYELSEHHLEILRGIAVHPSQRRQGIGAVMIAKLASKLSAHRRTRIITTVHETDLPRQMFYRSQGFKAVRLLRGYFGEADGYVLERCDYPDEYWRGVAEVLE